MSLSNLIGDALARAQAAQNPLNERFQQIVASLPPDTDSSVVFQVDTGEAE